MGAVSSGDAPLPDRRQARRLVVRLALFWALWAVMVAFLLAPQPSPIAIAAGFACGGSGFAFYYTLYDVWSERTGASALQMLIFPGFRASLVAWRAMFTLLRPSWIRATLRATEWPVLPVGIGLGLLLVVDLGLLGGLFAAHPPTRRHS
jgi:hypothetical protein